MKKLYIIIILALSIAACNKTDDIINTGNVPPPDYTIDSAVINIYITKVYINLLGREPLGTERGKALTALRQNNFTLANRKQFVTALFSKPEYFQTLFAVANNEYLRNTDSFEIEENIFIFNGLLQDPQYAPFYEEFQLEIARLDTLKTTLLNLAAGTVSYRQMLYNISNNYIYDQINMGSENFVVSMYQNFLFRYPSDAELIAGKTMVDGNTATVFLKVGKTKANYISIFFGTDDYYEGQVRFIFKKYLFREPSSAEIYLFANYYKQNEDYKAMELEFFAMDEYAGIK